MICTGAAKKGDITIIGIEGIPKEMSAISHSVRLYVQHSFDFVSKIQVSAGFIAANLQTDGILRRFDLLRIFDSSLFPDLVHGFHDDN